MGIFSFVYPVPRALLTQSEEISCSASDMYAMELLFPRMLQNSRVLAQSPLQAHWFLVPHHSTCFYHDCVFRRSRTPDECKRETGDYLGSILKFVQHEFPFWNNSQGTDHVLVFSWDQASEVVGWHHPVRQALRQSIHLTTLGSVRPTDNFSPHKDIVIPPFLNATLPLKLYPDPTRLRRCSPSWLRRLLQASLAKLSRLLDHALNQPLGYHASVVESLLPPSSLPFLRTEEEPSALRSNRLCTWHSKHRRVWAYFRGTILNDTRYSHGVRQFLERELATKYPDQFKIYSEHSPLYWQEMGDVTFSLCPSGWSSWSPRLFDSIMTGAIPVLFADGIRLPFEHLIDYPSFSIKLSDSHVSLLPDRLASLSSRDIQLKRQNLLKIRKHFVWNLVPFPGDAFHLTIQELFSKPTSKPIGLQEF